MHTRNLLNIRRAAYTAADWRRREDIFENLFGRTSTKWNLSDSV